MPQQTKEIISLREQITIIRDVDLSVFEIFEKRLSDAITEHINQYTERRLIQIKKSLTNANRQVQQKKKVRTKAAVKVKGLNIT